MIAALGQQMPLHNTVTGHDPLPFDARTLKAWSVRGPVPGSLYVDHFQDDHSHSLRPYKRQNLHGYSPHGIVECTATSWGIGHSTTDANNDVGAAFACPQQGSCIASKVTTQALTEKSGSTPATEVAVSGKSSYTLPLHKTTKAICEQQSIDGHISPRSEVCFGMVCANGITILRRVANLP